MFIIKCEMSCWWGGHNYFDNADFVCRYEDYYVDNDDDYEDNDDDYELPELNLVVGKVTFPQWQGNGGEVETSLSINYIHFRRDDNDELDDNDEVDDDDEVDENDEVDDDGHEKAGKQEQEW